MRTLTFTKSYTNSKGVQSFTTSTSLTGTNSGTRDGSVLTGRDRSNSSGSTSSLRMRSTSNASDMSGYTSDTSSGLRKRSASIDQVLTSNPAVDETDAITKKMSETNVPPVDETQALPSQHHPMRVIGCIDGDGLGLLTWW